MGVHADHAGITDEVEVLLNGESTKPTVKGPDPEVWGADHCIEPESGLTKVDYETKGPGPEWLPADAAEHAARHHPANFDKG
jgi:hypothetical protein